MAARRTLYAALAAGTAIAGGLGLLTALKRPYGAANPTPAGVHQSAGEIAVRIGPALSAHTASHKERLSVPYRPGITPGEIARDEGLEGQELYSIMAMVNGVQVDFITPLKAGDQVELMLPTAGG